MTSLDVITTLSLRYVFSGMVPGKFPTITVVRWDLPHDSWHDSAWPRNWSNDGSVAWLHVDAGRCIPRCLARCLSQSSGRCDIGNPPRRLRRSHVEPCTCRQIGRHYSCHTEVPHNSDDRAGILVLTNDTLCTCPSEETIDTYLYTMTSWHENVVLITDLLWGESLVDSPHKGPVICNFWWFICCGGQASCWPKSLVAIHYSTPRDSSATCACPNLLQS